MRADARVEQLVRQEAAPLLAFLVRRCADRADAADALSEVFVVLWRRRHELPDDPRAARAFAYGVARHVLANAQRADRRRSALQERLVGRISDLAVPGPDVDAVALAAALDDLPAADREVLRLVGVEDLTVAEIAQLLDLSTAAVRQRLHRARARLRAVYDDDASAPEAAALGARRP